MSSAHDITVVEQTVETVILGLLLLFFEHLYVAVVKVIA